MPISNKLKIAVRLSDLKSYEIAHQANLHPSMLSKIINGIELVKEDDHRVLAVARVLGLNPDECFRKEARE